MRKSIALSVGLILAAGVAGAAAVALWPSAPAPTKPAATDPVLAMLGPARVAVAPPVNEPAPPAPPPAPAAEPAADSLGDLPVQEIEPREVHAVPEGQPVTIPHVTLQDKEGHPLLRSVAPAPPPPSYVPSVGPGSNAPVSTGAPPPAAPPPAAPPPASYVPSVPKPGYVPSVPAPGAQQQAALPAATSTLRGPAHATGTVSLAVAGQTVRLYGVLPPASTDRCALGQSQPLACAEVTQAMLAARLARSASVTCNLPPGAHATEPARICVDASGADIASYLVSEGLAVVDGHAGGGYAGAESTARAGGKGLWRFR